MAKSINFDKFVKEFANDVLKTDLKKYEKAGKDAVKQIREDIVNEWFGEFNSSSVNEATQYRTYSKFFDDATAKIYIRSYVDVDAYKDKPSAQRWVTKYGGNLDPKEYVLKLQMVAGIIGLPEKATARPESNWKNKHFHQRPIGLRDVTFDRKKWEKFYTLISNVT